MADLALEEIIAVEQEIQERLELERRRIALWRAEEKARLNRESESRLAEVSLNCQQVIAAAESEAVAEVADLIRKAEQYRQYLASLPEKDLEEIIRKHLGQILPEEAP